MKHILFLSILIQTSFSWAGSWRFAVISDLNGSYGSTSYSSTVKNAVGALTSGEVPVDFVLSTGDMVAGQKSGLDYQAMWNGFNQSVTDPLLNHGIPLFPSPGNHDAYASRPQERNFYSKNWLNKQNPVSQLPFTWVSGVEQNYPFQYAFKIGQGLFISLDNTDVRPWSQSTLDWLEQVLIKESASSFKVIFGHVPLLPFAFKKESEYVARGNKVFLEKVESLFEKHQVSLFLSGHSHVYYPGKRKSMTRFISVPLLGSGPRYLISTENLPRSETAFLVFNFNDNDGKWQMNHFSGSSLDLIPDSDFPEVIRMPKKNGSHCTGCQNFPLHEFLDPTERILYRRQDL